MAKFKTGNPGRPKGAANRETREIRVAIQEMVNYIGEPARLRRILDRVEETNPTALINFMARVAPKDLVPAMGNARDTPLAKWIEEMSK